MGRGSGPEKDEDDAVFRSSRRVTFVVRSGAPSRRFSSSRVSRDPMTSVQVDVKEAPRQAVLGLEGDWSNIIAELSASPGKTLPLTLEKTGHPDTLPAVALIEGASVYIAAADEPAPDEHEGPAIVLDRDLFDLVRMRRAVIAVGEGAAKGARLVSYKSLAARLAPEPPAPKPAAPPPAEPKAAVEPEPVKAPEPKPVETPAPVATLAAKAPEPKAEPALPVPAEPAPAAEGGTRLKALTAPQGFPDSLQERLAKALTDLGPGIGTALLFQVEYNDGNSEYLLGLAGAPAERNDEIETAVNDALSRSRRRDVSLGITFLAADDPMLPRISRVGLTLG